MSLNLMELTIHTPIYAKTKVPEFTVFTIQNYISLNISCICYAILVTKCSPVYKKKFIFFTIVYIYPLTRKIFIFIKDVFYKKKKLNHRNGKNICQNKSLFFWKHTY